MHKIGGIEGSFSLCVLGINIVIVSCGMGTSFLHVWMFHAFWEFALSIESALLFRDS